MSTRGQKGKATTPVAPGNVPRKRSAEVSVTPAPQSKIGKGDANSRCASGSNPNKRPAVVKGLPASKPTNHGDADEEDESSLEARLTSSFWGKKPKLDTRQGGKLPTAKPLLILELEEQLYSSGELAVRVTLTTPKSNPKVFKFYCLDFSGEIEVVCFGGNISRIGSMIEVNGTYGIRNFNVRKASNQFPSGTGNDVVIYTNDNTVVQRLADKDIPEIPFNFSAIEDVLNGGIPIKTKIDVLAVATKTWAVKTDEFGGVTREIRLTDQQESEVVLTIVGEGFCKEAVIDVGDVVALRHVVVAEYKNVKLLRAIFSTLIWVHPVLPGNEGEDLRDWFQNMTA